MSIIKRKGAGKWLVDVSGQTSNGELSRIRKIVDSREEGVKLERKLVQRTVTGLSQRWLTEDEQSKLLKVAEPQLRAMIVTALHTGLRLSELLGLKVIDLDEINRALQVSRIYHQGAVVPSMSARSRRIPLSQAAYEALISHSEDSTCWLFRDKHGRPLNSSQCSSALKRACREAGIEPVGWHGLRHTFAVQLVSSGSCLAISQQVLGCSGV